MSEQPTELEKGFTNGSAEEKPAQAAPAQPMVIDANNVSAEQRLAILKHVYGFFSAYDRVPGALASQWGNALDALAVVVNSLTTEASKAAQKAASEKK